MKIAKNVTEKLENKENIIASICFTFQRVESDWSYDFFNKKKKELKKIAKNVKDTQKMER